MKKPSPFLKFLRIPFNHSLTNSVLRSSRYSSDNQRMKYIFLVLFPILASAQFTENVSVSKFGNKVILEGKDCSVLKAQAEALASWTKKLDEDSQINKCKCFLGNCKVNVSHTLPKIASENQSNNPHYSGPNCWNASLVSTKILPNLRYTTPEELSFWLNSPLCKEREKDEKSSPGDVIAIRDFQSGEVHGFIHLTDDLAFSKNGYDKNNSYSLQSPDFVFSTYNVPKDCRKIFSIPDQGICSSWANYYSCTSLNDYLKNHPIKDPATKETWEAINDLDCTISSVAMHGGLSDALKDLIPASVMAIATLSFEKMTKEKLSDDEYIIWAGIYYKAQALKDQLQFLDEN